MDKKIRLTAETAYLGGLTRSLFEQLEKAGIEMFIDEGTEVDLDALVKGWLQELLDRVAASSK